MIEPDKRELKGAKRSSINNPVSFLKALVTTMLDAHDNYHISKSKGDYDRTIGISTVIKKNREEKEIKATDYDLSREESNLLFQNGVDAAKEFIEKWDFEEWTKKYRINLIKNKEGS